MINTIMCIIGAFFIINSYLFYVHMFQLNSYFNDRFINWIKKNYFKKSPVIHRITDKKIPLKFTPRVKRLSATFCIIEVLFLLMIAGLVNSVVLGAICISILYFLVPVFVILANKINAPIEKSISNKFVDDARRILKEHKNLKVIGITGSYGKTSVKHFLTTLLQSEYDTLMTPGNFNTTMGVVRTVREYLKPTHEIFVCEMGAKKPNDIKEICDLVNPNMAIITSIGEQHLETFLNVDTIVNTKFELVDSLDEDGIAFLNYDNEYISTKNVSKVFKSYSVNNNADFSVKDIMFTKNGTTFTFVTKAGEEQTYTTKLIGEHNILNLTCCIGVCHTLGISLTKLVPYVKKIESVPHRLELKNNGRMNIIDDAYNSNPLGAKMAIDALSMFDGLRLIITPGMVELGEKQYDLNYELGQYCFDKVDEVLLVGKDHAKPIYNGVIDSGFDKEKVKIFDTFTDAFNYANSFCLVNDNVTVLLENDLPENY